MSAPFTQYTLRQSFSGHWYMIPFIMEWKWEQWNKYEGKTKVVPEWATPMDVSKLVFEKPAIVPPV